jgi:hypothetical protein
MMYSKSFIHVVFCGSLIKVKIVMKLRQAVLYWRRWDAGTVVTHNVIKLELSRERPESLE